MIRPLGVNTQQAFKADKRTIKKGMAVTNLSAGKDPKCTKLNAKLTINLKRRMISSIFMQMLIGSFGGIESTSKCNIKHNV